MGERQLARIEIEGYTSVRSASVMLNRLNVLVGANGAGKSNFIRALELLGRIVDEELNLFVGFNGGASALLNTTGLQHRFGCAWTHRRTATRPRSALPPTTS
jgi:predicted ATPase